MAAPYFIAEDQFIGQIQLDLGDFNKFSDFSTQVEKNYLIKLLGWQLYYALISDLDVSNEPQTEKYIELVNGIAAGYEDGSGVYRELAGIKIMLPYFFYYDYIKDVQSHNTEIGDYELQATNSTKSVFERNDRMINAYEIGRNYYIQLIEFIEYKNSVEGSIYYENFEYTELEILNVFGI